MENSKRHPPKIIHQLFSLEWKLQKSIMRSNGKLPTLVRILLAVLVANFMLFSIIYLNHQLQEAYSIIALISLLSASYIAWLFSSLPALTTVRGTLKTGFSVIGITVVVFSLILLFSRFSSKDSLFSNGSSSYALLCFISGFLWGAYCSLCNTTVSITANTILTSIFGLIAAIIEIVIIMNEGFPYIQQLKILFHMLLFPATSSCILAALICGVKKYWIGKYNNGNDINEDCIIKSQ